MKLFKLLLKIGLSLGLIALVVRRFDFQSLAVQFAQTSIAAVIAALVVSMAISLPHTARWRVVLKAGGARLAYGAALRMIFIGYFFNQTLPSSVGGDAVRVWCARRAGLNLGTALQSVIVDRGLTMVALLMMIAVSLPWLNPLITDPSARWAIVVVIAAGLIGFCIFLALKFLPHTMLRWRAVRALCGVAALARAVTARPAYAAAAILLSILSFCGFALMVFIIAQGMHVAVTLRDCLLLVPLVILVTAVPISIAGWGLRESAMVAVLGFVQVPGSAAFALSVMFGLTLVLTSLPGAILWWLSGYTLKKIAADIEPTPS